jgi:hypothetical protein
MNTQLLRIVSDFLILVGAMVSLYFLVFQRVESPGGIYVVITLLLGAVILILWAGSSLRSWPTAYANVACAAFWTFYAFALYCNRKAVR